MNFLLENWKEKHGERFPSKVDRKFTEKNLQTE